MEIDRVFGNVPIAMEVDELESKEPPRKRRRISELNRFESQIEQNLTFFCECFGIKVDFEVLIERRMEDLLKVMPDSLTADLQVWEIKDHSFYLEVFSRAYAYSLVQLCEHLRGSFFAGWSIFEKAKKARQWLLAQDFRCIRANGLNLLCLPLEVCEIASLEILDLANNEIFALPSVLGNLSHLEVLVLCDNNLSDVPLGMVRLQNLVWLNLSKNTFCHFPMIVCTLQKIKHLFFSHNNICQVPQALVYLRDLYWLDLSHAGVKWIPQGFQRLKYLSL